VVEKKALFLYKGFAQKTKKRGEAPMKLEMTVPEVRELINEIRQEPGSLFDMIRVNIQESVGQSVPVRIDGQ